ncbi:LPXTG cell wall anchor domain-containing protein [Streptomyces sp. NPDC059785]|uniref:LPXTG cell wall anchor domain-containing protein n=1 Tax=Streptomyces sp. NPDC059785 TaxID=3346945 RepID=UPI0036608511
MSARRTTTAAGLLLTASFSAAMVLAFTATADDTGPGSSDGGKAVDKAPAGVKLTTRLPERISVDNKTQGTSLTATVKNEGTKESGSVRLLVVGFDGMQIKGVKGCTALSDSDLPKGSNSAFSCAVGSLGAGASKSYDVDAAFDLKKTGKICLPVQDSAGKKTFWQQGPVPFGTTNPSPNAPATPLLLGTDNKPAAPGGDSSDSSDSSDSNGGNGGSGSRDELPKTGPADQLLPLGAGGTVLITAGAAGLWWTRRRTEPGLGHHGDHGDLG